MAREAGPFTTPRTARRSMAISSRGGRGGAGPAASQRRGQSGAVPSYRAPSASAPVASTSRIPTIARPPPRPNAYVAPVPAPPVKARLAEGKTPATPPKSEPRRSRTLATAQAQQGASPRRSSGRFELEAMSDDDEMLEDATRPEGLDLDAEQEAGQDEEGARGEADELQEEAEGDEATDGIGAFEFERIAGLSTRASSRASLAAPKTTKAAPARNAKSLSGLGIDQPFDVIRPQNRQAYSSRVTSALARRSYARSNNSDSFATAAGEPTVTFADDTVGGEDEERGGARLRQSMVAPDGTIHTPTLDERCEVLVTNSNAVLSFYTELVEEGVAEDSAQDMKRNWDPFESYKTNQLLAEGQYHHHFIDAREVVRNHNVPVASISSSFFDTMALVNRATFVHYVWQLPREADHVTTIEASTWAPRAALELLEARRVFLSWIVPILLPVTDDVLALYLDLCTEAYVFRLRQDDLEGGHDDEDLRERAVRWKESMFGVEAVHTALSRSRKARGLSSDDIANIETRFETFANIRMLECQELDEDWRFISEEWPLVRVASDLTRFVSALDRPGPMPACSSSLPGLIEALERSVAQEEESVPPSDLHERDDESQASVPDTDDLADAEDAIPSQSTPQVRRPILQGRNSSRAAGLESVGDEDQGAESDVSSLNNDQKMEILIQMAVDEGDDEGDVAAEPEQEELANEADEADEADDTVRGPAEQRIRIDSQNRLVKVDASSGTPGKGRKRLLEGTGEGVQLQEFDEGNEDVFMDQQIKAKRAAKGAKYKSKRKGKGKEDEEEEEGDDEVETGTETETEPRKGRSSKKKAGASKSPKVATEVVVEVPATPRMTRRAAQAAATGAAASAEAEGQGEAGAIEEQEGAAFEAPDFDLAGDDEMPDVEMDEAEHGEEAGQGRAAETRRRTDGQEGGDEAAEGNELVEGAEPEMSLPPPGQMPGLQGREGEDGEEAVQVEGEEAAQSQAVEAAEGEGFEVDDDELTLQKAREATKQRRRAARSGLADIGSKGGPLTPSRKYQGNQRRSKRREAALKAASSERRRSARISALAARQEEQDENAQDAEEAEEVDQLELDPTQSGAAPRATAEPQYKHTSRSRQPKPNKNASIYISGGNMNGKRSWTQEETETLLDALYRVARRKRKERTFMVYATVLKLHGPRGTKDKKLARWNNVQLKDKARNECLRMRREGRVIPYWRALLFPTLWEPKKERTVSQAAAAGPADEEEEEDQLQSDDESESNAGELEAESEEQAEAEIEGENEDQEEEGAESQSRAGSDAQEDNSADREAEEAVAASQL